MRNLKELEEQLASLQKELNYLLESQCNKKTNKFRTYEATNEYNSLLRRIHNTEININQEKMRKLQP